MATRAVEPATARARRIHGVSMVKPMGVPLGSDDVVDRTSRPARSTRTTRFSRCAPRTAEAADKRADRVQSTPRRGRHTNAGERLEARRVLDRAIRPRYRTSHMVTYQVVTARA